MRREGTILRKERADCFEMAGQVKTTSSTCWEGPEHLNTAPSVLPLVGMKVNGRRSSVSDNGRRNDERFQDQAIPVRRRVFGRRG
jgi:hypothetical protein